MKEFFMSGKAAYSRMARGQAVITVISFFILMFVCGRAFAETVMFADDFIYQAEDFDNMQTSRSLAFAGVKDVLLEHYDKYFLSTHALANMQLDKSQLRFFTGLLLRIEVSDEQWDGQTYRIEAKVAADPATLVTKILLIRKDGLKMKDLTNISASLDEIVKDVDRLKKELHVAEPGSARHALFLKDYGAALKRLAGINWFYDGFSRYTDNRRPDALDSFSRAIESDETNKYAYYYRAKVHDDMGDYRQALKSISKVLELDPAFAYGYAYRGNIYFMAFNDLAKATADYDKAIKLNPAEESAYYGLGLMRSTKLKQYQQAIKDFDKTIELNPHNANAYYYRGVSYGYLGDYARRKEDFKKSAEIGHPIASGYMKYNK